LETVVLPFEAMAAHLIVQVYLLTEPYRPWQTVYKRLWEWSEGGLIEKIFQDIHIVIHHVLALVSHSDVLHWFSFSGYCY